MKAVVLLFVSLLLSSPAFAGDFYVLDFNDEVMKSSNGDDTIGLKRIIRNQHPSVDVRDSDLVSVMVVAKTVRGNGRMHLQVRQKSSSSKTFAGSKGTFKSTRSRSFDRHLFKNPSSNSDGRWQLKLRGTFKVRQVVVELGTEGADLLTLDYFDKHIRTNQGDDDTLYLRRKAKTQKGLQPQDYHLEKVTIVAKSRRGNGRAYLVVGGERSNTVTLEGTPGDFSSDRDWTYYTYEIENPSQDSDGRWNIKLRGNIKVKEVSLHLTEK